MIFMELMGLQRADAALENAALAISKLIDLPVDAEHRLVLAHAIVGIAEATSRRSLTGDNDSSTVDPDKLSGWLAELTWFGLRGVR